MSALAQKTFQAFPIAYAAITCKQSEQMDKGERDVVCTKTLVEFAIPQFIVLAKAAAKKLELPLPLDIEDKMYLTSLGTGKKPAVSFKDKPRACWTKWETIKRDYTKEIQIIYDEGPQTASEFESGQSSEDYAAKLIEEVWQRSDECKKAEAVDLTQTTPAVIADAGSLSAAAARFQEVGTGSAGEGPGGGHEMDPKPECDCDPPQECTIAVDENGKKYWQCATEAVRPLESCFCYILHGADEVDAAGEGGLPSSGGAEAAGAGVGSGGGEAVGKQDTAGKGESTPVPDGWFHPYIIIAAAWSPWGGNCPTQWQNLSASDGKAPTNKKGDQIASGPLSSPGALAESTASARKMENNNGNSVSRRAHQAALKAETDRVRRDKRDNENMAQQEKATALKKEALQAMQKGNENSGKLVASMEEMVGLKRKAAAREETAAAAAARKRKIESIEKLLMLPDTDKPNLQKQLATLLHEEVLS